MGKTRKRDAKFTTDRKSVELEDTVESKVRSGMLAAAQAMPICAPAIRALNLVINDKVPTMGVDKYFRVYVNPNFVEEIMQMARDVSKENPCVVCGAEEHHEIAYVGGVICHEAWHPMREHHDRAKTQGFVNGAQFYLWNIATDCEINDDLLQIFSNTNKPKLCIPPVQVAKDQKSRAPGVLIPSTFELEEGKLAEEYYYALYDELKKLLEEMKEQEGQGDGEGSGGVPNSGPFGDIYNCGSAADGQDRPYEAGPPGADEPVPGVSEAEVRLIRKSVAKNIKDAAKNRGNIPGGWKRWAEMELEPPKYDWRQEMNRVIRFAVSRVPGDRLRTFRRLGRRTASLMKGGRYTAVLPSQESPRPRVTIVQDTSGSMDNGAVATSLSEASAILKASGAAVGFISCDMNADIKQEVSGSIKGVQLYGGGGTDMRIGIQAAEDSYPIPDIIVLFTDGYTPWPDAPLAYGRQLIVCLVGQHACDVNEVPDWCHTIRITGDDVEVRKAS